MALFMAAIAAGPLLAQANEALVAAVEAGDLYRLQIELTVGAEVNARNERGNTRSPYRWPQPSWCVRSSPPRRT